MDNLSNILTKKQIQDYLASLKTKGVALSTLKRKKAALNKFTEYAKQELGLGAPQAVPAKTKRAFSPKELFSKIPSPHLPGAAIPRFF